MDSILNIDNYKYVVGGCALYLAARIGFFGKNKIDGEYDLIEVIQFGKHNLRSSNDNQIFIGNDFPIKNDQIKYIKSYLFTTMILDKKRSFSIRPT